MGSKNKRTTGAPPSSGQPARQEVDRLIAKGWYKDAVRQAKICHRDQPTPEHHRLLEQAYLLRAQELLKNGMPAAAQEVASHLVDFGITDPDLTDSSSALLIAVGLATNALELQRRQGSVEALERLNKKAADLAVLHPERALGTPPEILGVARKVRSALEALTSGDEPKAQELLKDVARTSPLADWRTFAKGLSAFRRGEDAEARAAWDRLDPDRAASKLAGSLLELTGTNPILGPVSRKFEGLERWALGEPILGPLQEMTGLVSQGNWPEAIRKLGPVRLALRRLDPSLAVRLTEALYFPLLREATGSSFGEASNLIRNFAKAAEPLPIDPRWNRLWAQAWEGPQGHPEEAEPYWQRYIDDLASSTAIRPEDLPKARALVLAHQGQQWADLALDYDPEPELPFSLSGDPSRPAAKPAPKDPEAEAARRRAVALLEESRTLFPSRRATHQVLLDVFQEGAQPERAVNAAEALLQVFPKDLETLQYLSAYHSKGGRPDQALGLVLRGRVLKPLDMLLIQGEWSCRIALARQHALGGRWVEARAELAAAESLLNDSKHLSALATRKAALELKAGSPEVAQTILDEARKLFTESIPLWLSMVIEARRFELPQAEVDRFETLFKSEISKKVQGKTAGTLATILGTFLAEKIDYLGRDEHVRLVLGYLGRTTRISYDRDDLLNVCSFLDLAPGSEDLLKKLATRGVKLYPDSAEFLLLLGTVEMRKGPFKANFKEARKNFEAALRLVEPRAKTDSAAAETVTRIRQFLTVLNELGQGPRGLPLPFLGGGKTPSEAEMFEAFQAMMEEAMFDEEFEDDFDDDEDSGWDDSSPSPSTPLPGPRPARKPKKKKPKNKKKS